MDRSHVEPCPLGLNHTKAHYGIPGAFYDSGEPHDERYTSRHSGAADGDGIRPDSELTAMCKGSFSVMSHWERPHAGV
jgi:hypothetical protein